MSLGFKCIDIGLDKLEEAAAIHAASYPADHVSGSMGHDLIVEYYSGFLTGKNFFLGCVSEDSITELMGFVVFGKGLPLKITEFKSKNRSKLIKFFLSNPRVFFRFLLKRFAGYIQKSDRFDEAENIILSIVVRENVVGAGSFLMGLVDDYCATNNVCKLGLYVSCSNVRALNFYYKTGFKVRAFVSGQYYMEKNFRVSE